MALASIELKNVSLEFEGQQVLNNVSLSIASGERIVLIGPSGLGKTTLLKLMAGLISPTDGEVWVEGRDLHQMQPTERHKVTLKMGMLFQKNALFDSLTCGENIAFPLREVRNWSDSEIEETVDKFLEAVGLSSSKKLFPEEISGGMQKRLGIARALALDPQIVFYDDPTAGLDPITSRKIIELILSLQNKNKSTLIAVTNDMNRAFQMADRIFLVVDQSVIETGSPENTKLHADPRVQQFITGATSGPLMALS